LQVDVLGGMSAFSRGFLADQVGSLLGLLAEFGAVTAGKEPAVTPLGEWAMERLEADLPRGVSPGATATEAITCSGSVTSSRASQRRSPCSARRSSSASGRRRVAATRSPRASRCSVSRRPKPEDVPVILAGVTAAAETTLTIGEVSALTGLTTYTLRFYEQEGLFFAPVRRNAAGRRVFTEEEVEWLRVCMKLRSSGMPLPEIRLMRSWCLMAPATRPSGYLLGVDERVPAHPPGNRVRVNRS
jgi:hypothetical protein